MTEPGMGPGAGPAAGPGAGPGAGPAGGPAREPGGDPAVMGAAGEFAGLAALVTGGASGIGLATARMLADRGAHVAVHRLAE